jgi:DNA-binding beta-propeller fold protein YncE
VKARIRYRLTGLVIALPIASAFMVAAAFASTGALTPKGCWADVASNPAGCAQTTGGLASGADDVAVSQDGTSLYAASQSSAKAAIVMFQRDPSTGALSALGCIGAVGANPGCATVGKGLKAITALAISPDGHSLYAAGQALVHFQRNPNTGMLTRIGCVGDTSQNPAGCSKTATGFGAPTDVAVSPDGTSVYTTSYANNAVVALNRNTTNGRLSPNTCFADAASNPAGCPVTVKALELPNAIALTNDGRSLYVAAPGEDAISHFQRTSAGDLHYVGCFGDDTSDPAGCLKVAPGLQSPVALIPSPDGSSLYVASSFNVDDAIAEFSRNASNGKLTPLGCIGNDANTGSCASDPGDLRGVIALAVSADGESLYAAAALDEAVVRFDRDTTSGALTHVGCIGDVVANPAACAQTAKALRGSRALATSGDGKSLYDGSTFGLVRFKRSP